jgi:hypothetical protein
MPGYFDVYVMARERTAGVAMRFLEMFVPMREQSAVDYEFPQYSEKPTTVIQTASEAIQHCEAHPDEAQSFYFRNRGEGPAHGMLFFTADQGLILGLSVDEHEDDWLFRLKEWANSNVGYIASEVPPAPTAAEFRRIAAGGS